MTNEELLRERVAKLEVQMTHFSDKLDDTYKKGMHPVKATGSPSLVGRRT